MTLVKCPRREGKSKFFKLGAVWVGVHVGVGRGCLILISKETYHTCNFPVGEWGSGSPDPHISMDS